jgi:hypothetical protein
MVLRAPTRARQAHTGRLAVALVVAFCTAGDGERHRSASARVPVSVPFSLDAQLDALDVAVGRASR